VEVVRGLLEAIVAAFDPDWAVVTSSRLRAAIRGCAPDPFVGWLSYLPARLGQIPAFPPPARVIPLAGDGWLVTTRDDPLARDNPDDVALARRLTALLDSAEPALHVAPGTVSPSAATLASIVPRSKGDFIRAYAVAATGYPSVGPVLPGLLEWLQDWNWPVAHVLTPFLGSIGLPLLPHVHQILESDDLVWKYWILWSVVYGCPELATALADELKRLATKPTPSEVGEELDVAAREILARCVDR
jgi:hypothetical protein